VLAQSQKKKKKEKRKKSQGQSKQHKKPTNCTAEISLHSANAGVNICYMKKWCKLLVQYSVSLFLRKKPLVF
jgi:hypothetical protein